CEPPEGEGLLLSVFMWSSSVGAFALIRQAPHPCCQHSNLLRSEDALLSGHLVLAPIQDNVDDGGFRAAMQPDVVSEVRRTQSGIAFALGTMTGHAVRVVAAFAWHDPQGVGSQAGQ